MSDDRLIYELPTNLVVAAGAGTGKTHRLAGLYLHLVAGLTDVGGGPLAPPEIVATTFTREAAAEMRARIEHRLRALADADLRDLAASSGDARIFAGELLSTCARRNVDPPPRSVFRRALDLLPRGAITTFHAWAGELVRAHPIEAGVAPGFTLLDPEDSDALLSAATRDVLNDWLASDEHAAAARTLLHSGFDLLAQNIRAALLRAAEEGTDPSALFVVDSEEAASSSRDSRRELLSVLGRAAEKAPPKKDVASLVHAARAHAKAFVTSGTLEHARAFGETVKSLHTALPAQSEARAMLAAALDGGRGSITEQAIDILTAPERTLAAARLGRSARELLVDVSRAVTAAKRRARALDFGDVLRAARDLLRDHPEVQGSVVRDVRALLVDEFQDTNVLQRDLVYLARQAPNHVAQRAPGKIPTTSTLSRTGLFLVGDRKQSIYAFRGADVAVFQQIALDLAGDEARELLGGEGSGGGHGRIVSLADNRRSIDEILTFVNALSEQDMCGHDALSPIEQVIFRPDIESLRAVRAGAGEGGRVIVANIEPPPGTVETVVSADLLAALGVAAELRSLIEAGRVAARDCAILIRTYAPLPAIEFALSLHGVEYAVSAGRGLFATSEAGDVAALAQLLLDPRDRHALLAVLRGPFVALSDRSLLRLADPRGIGLDAIDRLDADERGRVAALLAVLEEHRLHGARLGAAAALRRAIDALRYEDTLALLPSGAARVRDLRRILEHADRFDTGLASFAEWLARGREGELDEARGALFDESRDAVRVMTIHGSKGLEFGTVFVMQIDYVGPTSLQGPLICARGEAGLSIAVRVDLAGARAPGLCGRALQDRALAADRAERQRLTYVALTRARDRLYLVPRPGTKLTKHSAAYSIGALLEARPDVATVRTLPARFDEKPAAPRALKTAPLQAEYVHCGEGSVVVTTALSDFATCPRRFRLLHVVGLPEHAPRARPLGIVDIDDDDLVDIDDDDLVEVALAPDDENLPVGPLPSDPRAQGVLAHLALERAPLESATGDGAVEYAAAFLRSEGYDPTDPVGSRVAARIVRFLRSSYARSLADARIERERAFIVPLPSGVHLRGTIDLVAVRKLGDRTRVEIVDYKSGPEKDIARYELQLRAYAAACARGALGAPGAIEGRVEIVAGVAFLGGGSGEPRWLPGDPGGARSIGEIDAIADRLLRARLHEQWPGIEPSSCVAIRCGFFPFCHPEPART